MNTLRVLDYNEILSLKVNIMAKSILKNFIDEKLYFITCNFNESVSIIEDYVLYKIDNVLKNKSKKYLSFSNIYPLEIDEIIDEYNGWRGSLVEEEYQKFFMIDSFSNFYGDIYKYLEEDAYIGYQVKKVSNNVKNLEEYFKEFGINYNDEILDFEEMAFCDVIENADIETFEIKDRVINNIFKKDNECLNKDTGLYVRYYFELAFRLIRPFSNIVAIKYYEDVEKIEVILINQEKYNLDWIRNKAKENILSKNPAAITVANISKLLIIKRIICEKGICKENE